MKALNTLLAVSIIALTAAIPRAQEPGTAAAPPDDIYCAATKWQLFYYYLNPGGGDSVNKFQLKCAGRESTVEMPDWLEKTLPAMAEHKVWRDPEKGELSEAEVWQTAVSILYEYSKLAGEALAGEKGKFPPGFKLEKFGEGNFPYRFSLAMDRLERAKLQQSFEGRGGPMMDDMYRVLAGMDKAASALEVSDAAGFQSASDEIVQLTQRCFSRLFDPPPSEAGERYRYEIAMRIVHGYRGATLPVPASQALFLSKGDRVDVLVTIEALMGNGAKELVTATILQNALVMSVFKPEDKNNTAAVELMLNPVEAQYLALSLVQNKEIHLILRAPGDVEMRPMEMSTFRKLFQ